MERARSAPLLVLLPLLVVLTACDALLAAGRWRTELTLSAAPLAVRPSRSAAQCVALCGRWSAPCAAVTLVAGTCRLHALGVCDDTTSGFSLVPLAGARYYDLYQEHWELAREGGADCETGGRCGWRCYCLLAECPLAGMFPNTTYTCNQTDCNLNAGYWQASATLALPLWAEEIATDGKLPIKKTFSVGDRLVFRFEFKASQIAEIKAAITGTAGEKLTVTAGTSGNTGLLVTSDIGGVVLNNEVVYPGIVSTSEYRRVALVFQPAGGCDITGADETVSLYNIPAFRATSLATVKFTSPPGVTAFWRMEAGMTDYSLLAATATQPQAPVYLGPEGAFMRVTPSAGYEFTVNLMGYIRVWVEFREQYAFQEGRVVRIILHEPDMTVNKPVKPLGLQIGVSSSTGFTRDDFIALTAPVMVTSVYTPVTLGISGSTGRVVANGVEYTLDASVALGEITHVGLGSDDTSGTIATAWADGEWSLQPWLDEGGRGYSTGNNLP